MEIRQSPLRYSPWRLVVKHLVSNSTHLIPGLLVPHFLSPWTNDLHKFDPPGQTVPIKFGAHEQMVPQNLVPLDKLSPINLVPIFPDPHSLSLWTYEIF